MRKIFIWIISVFFLTGCSNLISKKVENEYEKQYVYLYENWDLENLKKQLNENKVLQGENSLIIKYQKLLTEREKDKIALETLIEKVKIDLQKGDTKSLQKTLDFSLKNIFLGNEIEKVNFSQMNIYVTKPKFYKKTASNITAFNFEDRTIYFDVKFLLEKGEWKIIEFKERR
ncbi:hypothetical protein I6E43_01075 [Fusobacterium varium]|jgi:uncharacterized protein (DUF342 family)|uniref:Lipoprotein n=1 Tax=Fusobacterium varium ATCC 27725 TaxID=469618 RepID=A0ABN5JE00_FUSVA|nr:hypothetical protein C4N18_02300 [Fusobacterium varium ATCC 27725]MCF0170848.1 hypothetical protein [Fusobacterium varium]OFL85909.1 hypothetical protein HMPREF2747_02570 [Fusobacterium sp. HMSC073F01]EGR54225.1 hypothetical protein FVAG_03063 [Fusobacterium varium ATCC 27725]MCF2671986.1 hypothetical protein [Fusobacterium varium]